LYASFEQWTGKRELATLGTNAGSIAIPFQKWRHFKEAFAPEVVFEAIKSSSRPVQTCIDPFGGSGTTALACQFLGVRPTTIEINPYLADLIEAKLVEYDAERLVRDLSAVLRLASRSDASERLINLPATFVEPGINGRWLFDREVATRIAAILQAVESLSAPSHRKLFKVLLGGILVELSNTVVNGKGRRYRRGWTKRRLSAGDVDLAFAESATAAIGEINRFGKRPCHEYTVVRGDSRMLIAEQGLFDIAVFSPPYPNSFDYTDVYNIELWMLGYLRASEENRALRARTLTSHVQIHREFAAAPAGSGRLDTALEILESRADKLWSPHIPSMLGAYFHEMLSVIDALRLALHPGGSIWAVVGDSRYAGVAFNVAQIIAELVRERGFNVDRITKLREMRTSAQQGGEVQLGESLIILNRT
jgi:DNA modification methylase